MSKSIVFSLFIVLLGWVVLASANKSIEMNEVFTVDAPSVSSAVNNIKSTLESQGLEIVGVVDHAAGAATVDMELRPTQLILFRDKRVEKKLLRRKQTLAIDLPQKILVWQDEKGLIRLFYNGPGYLADRHRIRLWDWPLARIGKTLRQFGKLENGLKTIDSPFSVNETISNLTKIIEGLAERGFRIPFIIDFMENDKNKFYSLRPTTLLIFGNPNAGTPLMQNQQRTGIDLPQKFLVWEDRGGQVHITYNDIFYMAKRHGLQGVDANLETIKGALANFAMNATKK